MTTEEKAQILEAWLRSPPGTPPPDGLDPEVLAAVVTMRPERAPAPRVSIDDILGTVTEGPFKRGEVVAFAPRRSTVSRVLFALGSSGVLAAAAITLVVLPIAQKSSEAPPMPAATAPLAEAPAADAPMAPDEKAAAPVEAAPPAGAAAPALAQRAGPAENQAGLEMMDKAAQPVAEAAAAKEAAPPPAPPADAEPQTEKRDEPTIAEASTKDEERDALIALGYIEEEAGDRTRAEAPAPAAPAAAPATSTASSSAGAAAEPAKKAKAMERKSSSAADDADDASSVNSPRTAAVPTDYVASWYTIYPDVTTAYNAGNYRSLVNDARTDVAMDAAWRAATAAYRSGDRASARTLVDGGLRKSTANTVFRSQLLLLSGDLYTAAGDTSRATAAWNEAARLNRAR